MLSSSYEFDTAEATSILQARDAEITQLRDELLRLIQNHERLLNTYLGLLRGVPGDERSN